MSRSARLRVLLFSSLIFVAFVGGICVKDSQARPLHDSAVSMTKTAAPAEFLEIGEEITYTFVVKNTSGNELLDLGVSDPLVSVVCPASTLAAGAEMTCSGVYQITERDMQTGVVDNQATVSGYYEEVTEGGGDCCGGSGSETDYIDVSASASSSIIRGDVPAAFIVLTKTADPESFKWPGETITYTYTVENTGNTYIEGTIRVTDDMLEPYCPLGGLEPGQKMVCTAEYVTTEADMAARSIINTAVADAGDGVTSTDTVEVILEGVIDLVFDKNAQVETYSEYWQLIGYDLVVSNAGNFPWDGPITIDDDKLDEYVCPEIEHLYPGDTVTCQGFYRIRDDDIGKSVVNCATAIMQLGDLGTYRSNESCDSIYWVEPVLPCPDFPYCD